MSAIDPSYALLLFPRDQFRSPYSTPPSRGTRRRISSPVPGTGSLSWRPAPRRRRRWQPRSAAA